MEIEWDFNSSGTDTKIDPKEFGLSIIPVATNKKPIIKSWSEYQSTIAPIALWHSHYINQGTVGIITGKISGNLECIDIDIKNDPTGKIITEYSKIIPPDLLKKLVIQSTPSGGQHFIYRCHEATIDKNLKLALHSDRTVIIETRGEGGYFCTSKVNNMILQGVLDLENLYEDIPAITPEERNLLLDLARSLTRFFPTGNTTKNGEAFVYSEPAINEFNGKYSIVELFEKHGWSVVKEDDQKVYLLRDGSSAVHSGYYFKDTKTFFCFSTSTEFQPEKPYNHFQVLQVLEGKNDYRTTVRLLKDYGFEVKTKTDKITSDDIAKYLNDKGVRYDTFIQDLTINGKIIEELDYNTLYIDLKKHFDKEIPRTRFEETIKSNYIMVINPLLEFIEANIDRHPVGMFERWLDCMILKNKSIDRTVAIKYLKKWYVGMIAQALDGVFPNEYFLCLISIDQGIGKTSFLRHYVLPKELHAYRKERSLSNDDDFKIIMSQSLLIIDDEMDGRTYELDKTFKSILSHNEITLRRKYDRRISTIKRRCSFAGSGNNLYIVREIKNRRIIPLEIEKFHFDKLASIDLTDLFMEAYHLYANGFSYSFQEDNKSELFHLFADYIQYSDVDLIFDEYVQKPETVGDNFLVTNLDLVSSLLGKFSYASKRINVLVIGKLMAENGFETIRKGKKRVTCYCISKSSRIVQSIGDDTQSWRLNYGDIVG